MEKLTLRDVIPLSTYQGIRDEFRKKMIHVKNERRMDLDKKFTFLFENRDTVLLQVQEMIWIEKVTDEGEIQQLLDAYNDLVPSENELRATLFINLDALGHEALDRSKVKSELDQYLGIENSVFLQLGAESVKAEFEPGRTTADIISTVQYLKFKLLPRHVDWVKDASKELLLRIDHPNVKLSAQIAGPTRQSLMRDLTY